MPYPRHPAPAGALILALGCALAAALPAPVDAQIRRCATPEGNTVYTDLSCESLGAVETRPRIDIGGAAAAPRYRGGCAGRLDDLVYEVGAAIDAGDTNRLARSYHWTGMGTRGAYAVIDRLDAITQRPLVDIATVRPQPVAAPARPVTWAMAGTRPPPPATRRPAQPEALRIQQTLADGITPSTTTFGLRRHMDCWWITL